MLDVCLTLLGTCAVIYAWLMPGVDEGCTKKTFRRAPSVAVYLWTFIFTYFLVLISSSFQNGTKRNKHQEKMIVTGAE